MLTKKEGWEDTADTIKDGWVSATGCCPTLYMHVAEYQHILIRTIKSELDVSNITHT